MVFVFGGMPGQSGLRRTIQTHHALGVGQSLRQPAILSYMVFLSDYHLCRFVEVAGTVNYSMMVVDLSRAHEEVRHTPDNDEQ